MTHFLFSVEQTTYWNIKFNRKSDKFIAIGRGGLNHPYFQGGVGSTRMGRSHGLRAHCCPTCERKFVKKCVIIYWIVLPRTNYRPGEGFFFHFALFSNPRTTKE